MPGRILTSPRSRTGIRKTRSKFSLLPSITVMDSRETVIFEITEISRPVVLFAGEHTHSSLYQTTVGAYETGMREAHRILATIRKRKQ